ncbi:MAG TPA: hypothetical protein VF041_07690 [Gemmatimonadaceae bacterium]
MAESREPRASLTATVSPSHPRIGDPITVRVRLVLPPGATPVDAAPRFRDTLPEWVRVIGVDSLAGTGGALAASLRLVALRTGALRTPPLIVRWRGARGARVDTAAAPPVAITIVSVLPPTPNQSIRDIKGLERSALARALRVAGRALLVVLAAMALTLALALVRRHRRRARLGETAAAAPVLGPYDRALQRLDEIDRRADWRAGVTVDRHYQAVADVLRAYLAEAHAVPALERTTPELLSILPDPLDERRRREALRALLREADLAKFARARPAPDVARDYARRARALLERWRDAARPARAPLDEREEAAGALR